MTEEQIRQEVVARIDEAFARAQAEDPSRGPAWLAHTMQVSASTIHRLRNGIGDPSLLEVWRLANALGLPIGWFAGEAIAADQRVASAAERAETALDAMQLMLDQLREDLTAARLGLLDQVDVTASGARSGGAAERRVGRASASRRGQSAEKVSEPVAPARKAAG